MNVSNNYGAGFWDDDVDWVGEKLQQDAHGAMEPFAPPDLPVAGTTSGTSCGDLDWISPYQPPESASQATNYPAGIEHDQYPGVNQIVEGTFDPLEDMGLFGLTPDLTYPHELAPVAYSQYAPDLNRGHPSFEQPENIDPRLRDTTAVPSRHDSHEIIYDDAQQCQGIETLGIWPGSSVYGHIPLAPDEIQQYMPQHHNLTSTPRVQHQSPILSTGLSIARDPYGRSSTFRIREAEITNPNARHDLNHGSSIQDPSIQYLLPPAHLTPRLPRPPLPANPTMSHPRLVPYSSSSEDSRAASGTATQNVAQPNNQPTSHYPTVYNPISGRTLRSIQCEGAGTSSAKHGCQQRFVPKAENDYSHLCQRCYIKDKRAKAADRSTTYQLDHSNTGYANAYSYVYPDYPGLKFAHDDYADCAAHEDVWLSDLLNAVNTPYTSGSHPDLARAGSKEDEGYLKQQRVLNQEPLQDVGKHWFTSTNMQNRLLLLFHAVINYHAGGPRPYPIGGGNAGFGSPDNGLLCSERLRAVIEILGYDKRVVMNVVDGAGVGAFVENPAKYARRKVQNKRSNDTKSKQIEIAKEVAERGTLIESDDEDEGEGMVLRRASTVPAMQGSLSPIAGGTGGQKRPPLSSESLAAMRSETKSRGRARPANAAGHTSHPVSSGLLAPPKDDEDEEWSERLGGLE